MITEHPISFDLRERITRAYYTRPLILIDFIIWNKIAAIVHHNAVRIILNDIVDDPWEACLNAEYTLWSRLIN
jgi:hypothetical protein